MSQYIITIVPVVDGDFAGPVGQTMVRVDLAGGQPSVVEVTVRAAEGASLGHNMPYVDFERLMSAFIPAPDEANTSQPAPAPAPAPVTHARAAAQTRGSAKPARSRKAQPRRSAASAAEKVSHLRTGRVYRRAPSAADLEAAYVKTGSINGVAEHFGVPVHTAQGWISRMRRKTVDTTEK